MQDCFAPLTSASRSICSGICGAREEPSESSLLPAACRLLYSLGVTENYKGFRYASYAAVLAFLEQDRLLLVTKHLYPDVARHFRTNRSAVERDLRTVVAVAWKRNPALLINLAQERLERKPVCARFLAILSRSLGTSA